MVAIASLLFVLAVSFFITRLATVALTLTGVTRQLARLQSISAFSGVGFTTEESENIVNHPVRRRILIALMILGNAGVISAVSSLILSFVGIEERSDWVWRMAVLGAGLVVLWLVAYSKWVERHLTRAMRWALQRWSHLEALDYLSLLQLTGSYTVREMDIDDEDWLAGQRLEESNLFREGITVLGIHREDGEYVGVPRGETEVRAGDRLILYGLGEDLDELAERERGVRGEQSHQEAVEEQEERREEQRRRDEERDSRDSEN